MKKILLVIALALAAAACDRNKQQPDEPIVSDSVTYQDLVPEAAKTNMPEFLTSSFRGEVEGISANGLIRMQRDSVIWATASKVVELGRAKLTPDSIYAYIRINGTYVASTYDEVSVKLGRNITFHKIQDVLAAHIQDASPIVLEIMGYKARVTFSHTDSPSGLSFPFDIPRSARRLDLNSI